MATNNKDKIDLRKVNRNRVYRLIYQEGAVSKPEIAQRLGISLPTAIQNVKLLQKEGFLQEGKSMESTGGRKAVAVTLTKNVRYSIGIDITRNHISAVIINLKAEVIASEQINRAFENATEYYADICNIMNQMINQSGIDPQCILGVGFSVPGIMSKDGQLLIYSHVLNVSGVLCAQFKQNLPYPAILCNDANAAGYAEIWSDRKNKNAVYLSLSNSVGGAVLLDEDLYYGKNQRAGEFGHMTLVSNGLPCYCGRKGCVDSYCSAQALSQHAGGNLRNFFERLKNGEENLRIVWQQYLGWLAVVINNLTISFDCNVILGGYLGEYLDEYLDDLRDMVLEMTTFAGNETYVSVCKYKQNAAAVGAALQFIRPFIENV